MDISKIITICAFCAIFGVEFVLSSPTFGGEHVHIKVHIPHEVSSTKSKHTVIHHAPKHHVKHKVIHHYHGHQSPVKTQAIKEKAPLLENLYLAELDKPHIQEHSYHHAHGAQHKEETFLVKEQHHHHHVKPIEEINTVKVIEEHEHHHQHQPHLEYGKNHVETIKLIESGNDHHHHYHEDQDHHYHEDQDHHFHEDHDHHYQEDQDHHVQTVKFVEEKPQYHYHHEEKPANYEYHEPKEEVIKVIEAPKYKSAAQDYGHHYGHEPQVEEVVVEEEQNYHDYHTPPQTETVKIVETKPSVPKGYYNNYDPEDQLLHGIIEESLEIIKTKIAKNHNYGNHYQTHYGYQQQPKEQETAKPQEEYHHYQKVPATNYHYSHQPDVTVEEHIEYEKPNSHHYSQHTSTSGSLEPSQHYASHSAVYEKQSYDNKHKYATDYKPETPQDINESHMEYQKQNTLYEDLNTKDDYSKDVENPHAPETYRGHDSYSAGHVQGIGSGGYRYHMP
ncbi:histidine-rich glycoprotein [Calliphora vicina]|uniref:histidine-rich glycoprotein n=1 Tax=Calliphora vicina TaxID=7373 RepID=UPI00325B3059